MLYHFSLAVEWDPLEDVVLDEDKEDGTLVSLTELDARRQAEKLLVTRSLTPSIYASWKAMFRHRPRIRFNGIYISTVNYVRSGQASTNQATWGGSPIHIVTYYRYLRFFRDGAVISLLTTNEPGDVVHHVTKDNLHLHRDRDKSHVSALPSAVMYLAQKGRWRLSSALDYPEADPAEQESDLFIETEGAGPKYMYRMNLSLRSAGKGAKNNKLIWRSFHSYNKLTDDWGEFTLKNDKPFFFSRVKSYGLT
jgi:F-box protein 9